jgi:ribonuclease P protein component
MKRTFPRTFRLKSRIDFQAVYTKGRSVANRAAVLYVLPQKPPGITRVGFAAGKKLGNAVVRNRIKRRIKEAVRLLWARVKPGYFVIVIARQSSREMAFGQLEALLGDLFQRAALLQTEGHAP